MDPRFKRFANNMPAKPAEKKVPVSTANSQPPKVSEPNVYNPRAELYQQKEVYSPTQDVQDLYKASGSMPQNNSYNPMNDLMPSNSSEAGNNVSNNRDPRANRRDPRRRD